MSVNESTEHAHFGHFETFLAVLGPFMAFLAYFLPVGGYFRLNVRE